MPENRPGIDRRAFLAGVGLTGLALTGLTGCRGLSRQEPDAEAGAVSISILDRPRTTDKGRLDAYDETLRAFLAKHPTVRIDVREVLDGGAMKETLPAKLANKTMETMFSMAPEDASLYAARQQLAVIDGAAAEWDAFDQLRADVLDRSRDASGRLFGLPSRSNMRGIYYSRARFTQAGLDPDRPPTTWDQFREAAGRLTDRANNRYGFGDVGGADAATTFLNWLYSAGGQVQEVAGGKVTARLDSPQAHSVLRLIKEMRWDDGSVSPVLYQSISKDLMGEIATGRVAMAVHAPTGTADIRKFGGDPNAFSFGPTPQNGGNAAFEALVSFCFAPNATSEQIAAAVRYGVFKQFDPEAAEARLKRMKQDGTFVPLQSDSAGVLKPGSPLRAELDDLQATYATVSAATSTAYYEATNAFEGFGFPLIDPATVNQHIAAVVEAVLTKRDADIDALLGDLNAKAQKVFDE